MWWEKPEGWSQFGDCRRRAPIVPALEVVVGEMYRNPDWPKAKWPRTQDADGCGDWATKDAADAR